MKNQTLKIKKISSYIFLLMFISINLSVTSQTLVVEQDFNRAGACLSPKDEACVTIIASKMLDLSFDSNVDPVVNIAFKKTVGQNIEYTLHFPTDRREYSDRTLTIYCQSFAKGVPIPLSLGPKESELYYVSVTECYKTYLEKGLTLFKQCQYTDAKEEFRKAQEECSDAPPNDDVNNQIKVIDSIINLKKLAKESFEMLDFCQAEKYYKTIFNLNKDDNFAYQKYIESKFKNNDYCEKYMKDAILFYDYKEYEKAETVYRKIIKNGCSREYVELANLYLEKTKKKLDKAKNITLPVAITFQWAYSKLFYKRFGLSIGRYPDKKVSAYFTFMFNSEKVKVDTIYSGENEIQYKYDFDASLGLTIRPVKNKYVPLWLTVGMGYSGLIHSVSPEVGILAKIPFGKDIRAGFVLRYTFQYRYAVLPETRKLVSPFNHIVGVGFCF